MNEKIYLHGIGSYFACGNIMRQNEILIEILESRYLKSRRLLGKPGIANFSGLDYISLCDYEKRNVYNTSKKYSKYNAYNGYILNLISLSFPKDKLDVIKPVIVNARSLSEMERFGLSKYDRYSDLPDEVQVKDSISLDNMNMITFPVEYYLNELGLRRSTKKLKLLKEELEILKNLINRYDYNVPIYDIGSMRELTNDNIEEIGTKVLEKKL